MQDILTAITNNPMASLLIASPVGGLIIWAVYQSLIKIFINDSNIDKLSDAIDKYIDKLQSQNKQSGELTRSKLIYMAEEIIKKLKDPSDGIN